MSATQENSTSDEGRARAAMEAEESLDTLQGPSIKTAKDLARRSVNSDDLRKVDKQEEDQPKLADVSLQDDDEFDDYGRLIKNKKNIGELKTKPKPLQQQEDDEEEEEPKLENLFLQDDDKIESQESGGKDESDDHSICSDQIAKSIPNIKFPSWSSDCSVGSSAVASVNSTSRSLVHDKRLLLKLAASQKSHRTKKSGSSSELLQDRRRKFRTFKKRGSSFCAYKPDNDEHHKVIIQEILQQSKKKQPKNVDEAAVDKYMWSGDNYDIDPIINIHETNTPYVDDSKHLICFTVCLLLLFLLGAVFLFGPFQDYKSMKTAQKLVAVRSEPLTQDQLLNFLLPISPNLLDAPSNSPQRRALEWLHSTQDLSMANKRLKQRYILAVFYHSTSGPQWNMDLNNRNWLTNQYECEWTGVKCNEFCENEDDVHSIRGLELQGADLDGQFPDEISHLEDLDELLLPDNHLKGAIPSSILQLSNLKLLELQHNEFQGGIPKRFHKLTQLQSLNLSHNQLKGVIPYGIGNLKYLTYLNLGNNQLEGELPMEFMNLKQLKELRLERNKLVGEIPNWVDQWQLLEVLSIQRNEFFGAISNIRNMTNVAHLDLSENAFEGTIPDLQTSTKLEVINLSKNKLSGLSPLTFPSQIMEVHVSHNKLAGIIPEVWGSSMKKLTMQGNLLEGSMPKKVCDLKLRVLESDCGGEEARVQCDCCTSCFEWYHV